MPLTIDTSVWAHHIADQACVADIETGGVSMGKDNFGRALYDVRPMLDLREQPPEVVDMAQEAIDYAVARGLVATTAQQGVVVIVRRP